MSQLAISIRQPWAWLILHAGKDIENRIWPTKVRGRVFIHASKEMTKDEYRVAAAFLASGDPPLRAALDQLPAFDADALQRGGIVGEVEIVDCVNTSASPWFVGGWGFVLRHAKPLPFRACPGRLGFFQP